MDVEQRVSYKVYYEDTDSMGVVYHANYLRFFERGRSEFLGASGSDVRAWNERGLFFAVTTMNIAFCRPARLGDVLDVVSSFALRSAARGLFAQRIERAGELLVSAEVEIACLDAGMRPRRFPPALAQALAGRAAE